jgi:hypothetical protein
MCVQNFRGNIEGKRPRPMWKDDIKMCRLKRIDFRMDHLLSFHRLLCSANTMCSCVSPESN